MQTQDQISAEITSLQSQLNALKAQQDTTLKNKNLTMKAKFIDTNVKTLSKYIESLELNNKYFDDDFNFNEIIVSLQETEQKLKKMLTDPLIHEFVLAKNIQKGTTTTFIMLNGIMKAFNQWYREKYFTECPYVSKEILLNYFLEMNYDVNEPTNAQNASVCTNSF